MSEDSRGVSRRVSHLVLDHLCKFHEILVRREFMRNIFKILENFGGRRCW